MRSQDYRCAEPQRRSIRVRNLSLVCMSLLAVGSLTECSSTTGSAYSAALYGYPPDADYALGYAAYDPMYVDDWGAELYAARLRSSSAVYADDAGPNDRGAGSTTQAQTALEALRAAVLAQGGACADTATLEPKRSNKPCGSGEDQPPEAQTGFTLTVTQCKLRNGATLDGRLEVTSTYTASDDACDANTTLKVDYTATYTDLTYVAIDGTKTVISKLTDSGSYERKLQEPPATIASRIEGEIKRYDSAGGLTSSRSFAGDIDYQISHPPLTLVADATLDATNTLDSGKTSVVAVKSLTYQASCCHPTGGTITVTGAENTTYEFGPACGEAERDGSALQLSSCR